MERGVGGRGGGTNNFEKKYNAKSIKDLVSKEEIKPSDLFTYLNEANAELFDTPVIGAEVYKSTDGGYS